MRFVTSRPDRVDERLREYDRASRWSGRGIDRDVFFFSSTGERLYGSLFAASKLRGPLAFVLVPSWGLESRSLDVTAHTFATRMARGGRAAMLFHPPGHGDSTGDAAATSMEDLVMAATDALDAARQRRPQFRWELGGIRLGASIAGQAAAKGGRARPLLFIEPALAPAAFFEELERASRRAGLGRRADGEAFGYPLPMHPERWPGAEEIAGALASSGGGVVVRLRGSPPEPVPETFAIRALPGSWQRRLPWHSQRALARSAAIAVRDLERSLS